MQISFVIPGLVLWWPYRSGSGGSQGAPAGGSRALTLPSGHPGPAGLCSGFFLLCFGSCRGKKTGKSLRKMGSASCWGLHRLLGAVAAFGVLPCRDSPSLGFNWERRELPQPRTRTCIFSRSRPTHPSCGALKCLGTPSRLPLWLHSLFPVSAGLEIALLLFFFSFSMHVLPARCRRSVLVLGQRWCPSLA